MRKKIRLFIFVLSLNLTCIGSNTFPQTTTTNDQEFIETIISKVESIDSIQYTSISTTLINEISDTPSNYTIVTKIYDKKPNIRIKSSAEHDNDLIPMSDAIVHPDAVYIYDAYRNEYMPVTSQEGIMKFSQVSLQGFINQIKNNDTVKRSGTDVIDGKKATIIEFFFTDKRIKYSYKIWVWDEKGIPLRSEITSVFEEKMMVMRCEFANISFKEIPDSLFQVPED